MLVFLEVNYENTLKRSTLQWYESDYLKQLERLANARENANLIINTNNFTQDEVLKIILNEINTIENK